MLSLYINAKVAGNPVTIFEASIRSDLHFNNVDGIEFLNNQAISDAIKLMGTSWDQIPTNIATTVICLTSNQKFNFSKLIFDEDEGEGSVRPFKPQPTPSPPHPSEAHVEPQSDPSPRPSPTIPIPEPIPEGSGGNIGSQSSSDKSLSGSEGGLTLQSVYDLYLSLCTQVTTQAAEIKSLKAQVKKLKKQAMPFILHHKAWLRTVKRKNQHKKKVLKTSKRRSVFKQGRKTVKSSKGAPTVPTNTEWDDLDMDIDDTMDYTLAQDEGKTDKVDEKGESTAQQQSTDRQDEGTDMPKVSTARTKLSTDKFEEGTAEPEPRESTSSAAQTTPTPTPTTFGDDETIAQVLLNMSQAKAVSKEKEKGVEIRNAENAERPRTTSTRSVLTLKPLPKIDPNDKGKKRIEEDEESDTESEEITEAKKKFDQIAHDEEVARKIQEEWEAEEERKRLTEEEATKTALSNEYDFIQARIEADRLLAERVQEAEREQFTVEERAKFLHDTIATQRRILAQQRSEAIRNKPPTKNQFRNQMMTYLKHVGNKKHADLKTKSFDEIKALYEKVKRFDDSFITIGSTEDERKIKEMNEGASDPDKKKKIVKEDVSAKVPAKQDVAEQGTKKRKGGHMKMIARKRKRPQPDVDSDDEHRKCLKIVTFEGTIDSEIMETKSFISKLDKVSSPEGDYLVVYRVNGNFRAFNYLMEVLHIFDRQDLFHLYDLVMKQYSESTPEGIELILWGDLKIMMESSIEVTDQGDFWNDQQDWEIVTWRLYEACGVCILEFKDGTVIHMLVERKYPLSKELLQRMLDFGLEVEVESTAALDLIRVLNSPCFMVKSWLVQDQTVLGKDYSNLLIADSLLKTIWFINAPCYGNEALASPKANGVCCDAEEMRCKFKIESESLDVDKAKINVISKLPPPTNVKGIRSFLGYAGFYQRFIKDFSKIARPLTKLLEKDIPFEFDDECHKAFNSLKEKLTCTPVIVSPNWNLPFELMCDASDFAVGVVLGQKDGKNFHPIYFASKTLNAAQQKYTVIEKELMAVMSDDSDVDDNFPGETLMEITTNDTPWFADFANYLVGDVIPKGMTYQQKKKFFSGLKNYFWEDPYLFKVCSDGWGETVQDDLILGCLRAAVHPSQRQHMWEGNLIRKKVLDRRNGVLISPVKDGRLSNGHNLETRKINCSLFGHRVMGQFFLAIGY
ncbi:reverse transcriptase domain-containing protein [Tanacetum coccineum]